MDIDNLTVNHIRTMEQDIACGVNFVRHKYSNETIFEGKPLFLKFCEKKVHNQDTVVPLALKNNTKKH